MPACLPDAVGPVIKQQLGLAASHLSHRLTDGEDARHLFHPGSIIICYDVSQ